MVYDSHPPEDHPIRVSPNREVFRDGSSVRGKFRIIRGNPDNQPEELEIDLKDIVPRTSCLDDYPDFISSL